ncbi:oligopeptide/dipeptide ABC transporter ATP-binding protein [Aliiglaciecola sp. LCG003]|uniref:oligopeptide/dipeptide ABC transporter ATP-binding protein n=1 Tax=Aliiglaciecola sp. LCG003 TaxID=3053655 RepID=UPI002573AF96|nr:oligopeptide/dipeptide ABC transporter ATP-binding protein [Aliiglaciecola sp. LCG003]WJG08374.1 ATP-binding cassette domain-containing protein [Aliiglaciecola sp. LCG003]
MPLLDIKNLTLEIEGSSGWMKALDKVNLKVESGEIRALVGESGSGKSLIIRAIVGAIPENWRITADRLTWKGKDLLSMNAVERRQVMRSEIAVIFQNPLLSLDPSSTLGEQLMESIPTDLVEGKWFWQKAKNRKAMAIKLLHKVGIKEHDKYLKCYPNQIADDICQKFLIACALVSSPELLIADDPTRGMEITTKTQVLKLLTRLNKVRNLSILFVSHDLLAISSMANTMTVLYCGQTVEDGQMAQLRKRPLHPYTKALLDSAPSFRKDLPPKSPLAALDGTMPTLQHLPIGCRLGPRCPRAQRECVRVPELRHVQDHYYSCHFPLIRDRQ